MIDISNSTYEDVRRVVYPGEPNIGDAVFVPICTNCGRFVKADESIFVSEAHGLKDAPNATCKKCGRVEMIFEGFM